MLVVRTIEDPAYSVGELAGSQQSVGFYDLALAVYPHLGSMALSHGLFLGSTRQLTILTPRPLFFTSRHSSRLLYAEYSQNKKTRRRSSRVGATEDENLDELLEDYVIGNAGTMTAQRMIHSSSGQQDAELFPDGFLLM